MKIQILLADDHKIVRDGLRSLLEKHVDITVIGEADDGRAVIQLARDCQPQVIVMDISLPELNGIEATRHILSETPGVKIIALSMHSDKRFVIEMFKAGASGYLLKDCAFDELILAVRTVVANEIYLSPKIATLLVNNYIRWDSAEGQSIFDMLSAREREVLQLLAEGNSTKQTASKLFLSVKTVESHRLKIMEKLNIHNLPDLVKFAIREGLTSLDG